MNLVSLIITTISPSPTGNVIDEHEWHIADLGNNVKVRVDKQGATGVTLESSDPDVHLKTVWVPVMPELRVIGIKYKDRSINFD